MRVLIRRAAVVALTSAVVSGSAVGVATAGGPPPPVTSWSQGGMATTAYTYGTVGQVTFTLTNSGGSATSALTITLTPVAPTPSATFSVPSGGDGCTGTSLGPKKSCSVTVLYTPSVNEGSDSATLIATSNKQAAAASLTLFGSAYDCAFTPNAPETGTTLLAAVIPDIHCKP